MFNESTQYEGRSIGKYVRSDLSVEAVMRGVKKGWEIMDDIQGRFCNRGIRTLRNTEKGAAEWILGRESRRGTMLCSVVKYWHRTLLMEKDELLKCCYELQVGNLKCDGCPRHLSNKLYKIGLGCICLDRHGRDLKNIRQIIKTSCNDIRRQSNREKMKDSKVLVSYWNMK
jgi:hypothetical protein